MALGNGPAIIWLDDHIGSPDNCRNLKELFADKASASINQDPLDIKICAYAKDWRAIGAPLEATDQLAEAVALIEKYKDKNIKFICSATLGKTVIPVLTEKYPNILSYYVFCGYMRGHVEWAIEYTACLQMFDHEDNLLEELTRDIAKDFREHGNHFQQVDDLEKANQCFQHAQTLEERVEQRVKSYRGRDINFRNP